MAKYAVIFDTNSYRKLVSNKTKGEITAEIEEIIKLEESKDIVPFASVIVGMEMLANLTEGEEGFNFKDCLNGVIAMATHCQEKDNETLRIFPNAALHILKSYFNFIPEDLKDRNMNLGGVINDIKKDPERSIKIHNERNTFEDIKNYVNNEEVIFSNQITTLLEEIRSEFIKKHPNIANKHLRAKLLDYIENGSFEPLMALGLIFSIASKYQLNLPQEESIRRAFSLNMEFPLSVGFFRWIAYKIIDDNIDMSSRTSKEKRWNWVWDYHVSFALNNSTINDREVIVVTSDKDLTEIIKDFGYENKVLTLEEYLKFLKE